MGSMNRSESVLATLEQAAQQARAEDCIRRLTDDGEALQQSTDVKDHAKAYVLLWARDALVTLSEALKVSLADLRQAQALRKLAEEFLESPPDDADGYWENFSKRLCAALAGATED